ncbi:MAG: hypothetical protein LBD73_06125 [Deferribacteraceae bacterium]|jgi:hypothetical protein|nr:hypothetical protein [Deferribacteraceae bacterium]
MKTKGALIFAVIAVLLIAAITAGILLIPEKENVLTAESFRNGYAGVVCEDAVWLYEMNKRFISEKFELLPEDNFSTLQEAFWDNITPAQNAITVWHNEVLSAIAERTRGNSEAERIFSHEVGEDMLRLYQTAMAVNIGLAEDETALNGIREEFCK